MIWVRRWLFSTSQRRTQILFWRQKWVTGALHGNSLVVRRVSSGRIKVVLFWTKYAVSSQINPGILKLTTSRGQRNLCTVFIFVSCEEKGCYRIVSLGHQNFDCRSYCGLSRRIQGSVYWQIIHSDQTADTRRIQFLFLRVATSSCSARCSSRSNKVDHVSPLFKLFKMAVSQAV